MSILIKGIPLAGYEISIMKDGERYRARVDGIWCEVEEIPTTDTDSDTISRKAAIDFIDAGHLVNPNEPRWSDNEVVNFLKSRPSAQPERVWHPVEKPPAHHKDVIVRGVEAIGNVTVHKVMQWDVDTWRPTDYAPSIMWTEWSEI